MSDLPVIFVRELQGPSARQEALGVFRALMLLAFGALFLIGRNWTDDPARPLSAGEAEGPYQLLFRDLSSSEQRMFRRIQEGVTEAENLRPGMTEWPTPEALAAQGIPPFTLDPLAPTMTWSFHRSGSNAIYLGTPSPGASPAFLVLIQEPSPGTPGDPPDTLPDELHHRLASGVILHVTIWEQREGRVDASPAVLDRPYLGGWKQIQVQPLQVAPADPRRGL